MKKIVLSLVTAAGMGLFAASSFAAPITTTSAPATSNATLASHHSCHKYICRYSHHHHKKICYWINKCH